MLTNILLILNALENLITALLLSFMIYLIALFFFVAKDFSFCFSTYIGTLLFIFGVILILRNFVLKRYNKIFFKSLPQCLESFFQYYYKN